jgi:hypothetical protein
MDWIKLSQLTALSDLYTLEKFQNYKINQNFRFKIVEIKYGGIKKVFDKTIPFIITI